MGFGIYNTEVEKLQKRSPEILKMECVSHITGKHAVDISEKGFVFHPGL